MKRKELELQLDKTDYQILKLLDERMELALKLQKLNGESDGVDAQKHFFDRIKRRNYGLAAPEVCTEIFKSVFNESRRLQSKNFKLIGFQGAHGAYSDVASKVWNPDLIPIPNKDFTEVFENVAAGIYDYGIVPVENSLGGVISQVNQLIIGTELYVAGAVELNIHHCLLALPGTDHRELRTVYSHTQALEQCHHFLVRNKLEPLPFYDTAGSAKMLAEQAPKASAAIASKLAADIYHLEIIKEDIEDFKHNITRFLIFSKEKPEVDGNKCSIIFSTAHKAGTLFKVLEVFARSKLNLTRIESIPNQQGSFAFFLDFIGSDKDEKVRQTLDEVRAHTRGFRLLGCYEEKKQL
jgi:prephenate dehydratase/chorismate mutase/prephenate dehydratase